MAAVDFIKKLAPGAKKVQKNTRCLQALSSLKAVLRVVSDQAIYLNRPITFLELKGLITANTC